MVQNQVISGSLVFFQSLQLVDFLDNLHRLGLYLQLILNLVRFKKLPGGTNFQLMPKIRRKEIQCLRFCQRTGNTCHAFYIFCKFYSQCCKWESRLRDWTYPRSPNKIIKQNSAPQGRNLKAMVLIVLTDKAYHTQSVRRAGRKRLFPANECLHVTRSLDLTNEDALLLLASMMLHIQSRGWSVLLCSLHNFHTALAASPFPIQFQTWLRCPFYGKLCTLAQYQMCLNDPPFQTPSPLELFYVALSTVHTILSYRNPTACQVLYKWQLSFCSPSRDWNSIQRLNKDSEANGIVITLFE